MLYLRLICVLMGVLKLHLDDFNEVNYNLIAIHTSLEDYRLAFLINQQLPILLHKNKKPLEILSKNGEVFFSKFSYIDTLKDIDWHLIQNKNEIVNSKKNTDQNLFFNKEIETVSKVFLISEYKNVDFFLKIENSQNEIDFNFVINKINKINNISTVYNVDPTTLKSKNNLIF
jgi:hypothetical protein